MDDFVAYKKAFYLKNGLDEYGNKPEKITQEDLNELNKRLGKGG